MMPSADEEAEIRACTLAGSGLTVEYSSAALNEIVAATFDGFLSFPFGGLEVGGVLFGVREGDILRIVASRPVACEHAFGPGYTLSENDRSGLRQLLEIPADPALAGLAPLGWYHSHTRGGLTLTATDIELHERYFPEGWQVAMVLLPRYSKPTRVGLFARHPEGGLPEAPDFEFESGHVAAGRQTNSRADRAPVPEAPAEPPLAEPPGEEQVSPVPQASPGPEPDLLPEIPAEWDGRSRRWIWAFVAVFLALLGGGLFLPRLWRKGPAPPPLALRLIEKNGRLDIRWNAAAPAVRQARRGVLEITDGLAEVAFPLDARLLQVGSWSMVRQSAEVQVRLEVQAPGQEAVEESAHFVGSAPAAVTSPRAPVAPLPKETSPADIAKLRLELKSRLTEVGKPPARGFSGAQAPAPAAVATPPRLTPPRRTFRAPELAARRTPPGVMGLPDLPEAQTQPGTPPVQPGRLPDAPAPPPAEAVQPPPAHRGPKSGRLIWTGFLAPNSLLTIDKGRPSGGHLNGELPGVPCRVGASPAEFAAGGLTVYSANPRFERTPGSEPPGPQNGWNRTVFRYDVKLSRDLVVVEAPGAPNGWNRVVLRAGERPLAVLLLEWEIIP